MPPKRPIKPLPRSSYRRGGHAVHKLVPAPAVRPEEAATSGRAVPTRIVFISDGGEHLLELALRHKFLATKFLDPDTRVPRIRWFRNVDESTRVLCVCFSLAPNQEVQDISRDLFVDESDMLSNTWLFFLCDDERGKASEAATKLIELEIILSRVPGATVVLISDTLAREEARLDEVLPVFTRSEALGVIEATQPEGDFLDLVTPWHQRKPQAAEE